MNQNHASINPRNQNDKDRFTESSIHW